ncbi:hypothetical protein [Chamaesiphon sp. VAR_48_metabat_135_sub]|uniref:hypothetical protein n=1 Tax=Chamaesiphon sp. VAR_48_metabat_135_sub TaxID=2964699 RepID=UPI00286C1BFE|nr:hypothetical protein [Chamaesiphon sp. VAR_48_metabat_135_sub]
MTIYTFELQDCTIAPISQQTFQNLHILERTHLQKALRDRIAAISPDTLIISEEFSDWSEGTRRIDLLGIDRDSNIVVIELKRDETGSHMELQALRYAAMVSTLTFKGAIDIYQKHLNRLGESKDAEIELRNFLGGEEQDVIFPNDVRIVLAAANFSPEITTTAIWLNQRNLDIRCVRLTPYQLNETVLLDIEQIIPLPEAQDYQVKVREQSNEQRSIQIATKKADHTRYLFDGNIYNKRRLVLAVISKHVKDNSSFTCGEIEKAFSFQLVVSLKQEVKFDKLYFMKPNEVITTVDGEELVVYNQWTIDSITKFIDRVRNDFKYQIDIYQESEDFN